MKVTNAASALDMPLAGGLGSAPTPASESLTPSRFGEAAKVEIKNLDFKKPVGESGTEVRAATRSNSFIQVYAFEAQHKAAQRRQARQNGAEVDVQKITIKVTLDESGRPIAIGGETSTTVEGPNGEQAEINELALLSDFIDGKKSASAAFFGDSRRHLPQFFIFDSFLSRLNIEGQRQILQRDPGTLLKAIEENVQDPDVKIKLLDQLRGKLSTANLKVNAFSVLSPFNNKSATVNLEGVFEATPLSSETPVGTHAIEVLSIARSQEVAIDVAGKDFVALGQSGEFKLNGVSVTMIARDSIIDFKNLINRGEDTNGNGHLDNIEDFNNNGVLDPGEDTNGNGRLDTHEDINGNLRLDPGEDINFNGKLDISEDRDYDRELDLGTEAHGIKAVEFQNVVRLIAVEPNGRIEFEDENSILEAIGLIEEPEFAPSNEFNNKVFKHVVFSGSDASAIVNGDTFTSETNVIEDAIEGVSLNIKSHLQEEITLDIQTKVEDLLSSFESVVAAFNDFQAELNALLKSDGLFRDSDHIGRVKTDSINAFRFEASPPTDVPAELEDLGVTQERQRVTLAEPAITAAVQRFQQGNPSVFDGVFGVPTVQNTFNNFGLTGEDDGVLTINEGQLKKSLEEEVNRADEELGALGFAGRLSEELRESLLSGAGDLALAQESLEARFRTGQILEDLLSPRRGLSGLQLNVLT